MGHHAAPLESISGQIQEPMPDRLADGRRQTPHVQLVETAFDVLRHRVLAEFEFVSDFLTVEAFGRKLQDFALAPGQSFRLGNRAELAESL